MPPASGFQPDTGQPIGLCGQLDIPDTRRFPFYGWHFFVRRHSGAAGVQNESKSDFHIPTRNRCQQLDLHGTSPGIRDIGLMHFERHPLHPAFRRE